MREVGGVNYRRASKSDAALYGKRFCLRDDRKLMSAKSQLSNGKAGFLLSLLVAGCVVPSTLVYTMGTRVSPYTSHQCTSSRTRVRK